MLTADLVQARRKGQELQLVLVNTKKRRARALALAEALLRVTRDHIGHSREDLTRAWASVDAEPKERKLVAGLKKLIGDRLRFEVLCGVDPIALRKAVFEMAAAERQSMGDESRLDRAQVLKAVGDQHDISPEAVERALFADLRGAHRVMGYDGPDATALIDGYDLEQARAVLLRAVQVVARIEQAEPAAARALFRKLKFLRLLHRIERSPDGAMRIEIDGPYSLFESVTKYGLLLALALPSLGRCGRWSLVADIRWGKERRPLTFTLAGDASAEDNVEARLPDDVQALYDRFVARGGRFVVEVADEVVHLPGVGLCVPDLRFVDRETGTDVLLEVMGYWSRDAVFRRVELVAAGLPRRLLFAVSSRLRVSEAVLDEETGSALYVYKGAMSVRDVEARLARLVAG